MPEVRHHEGPPWLGQGVAALVADGTQWHRVELEDEGAGRYVARTPQGLQLDVRIRPIGTPPDAEGSGWRLTAAVSPGDMTSFAGLQLLLPIRQSLRCAWKSHLAPKGSMAIGDKAFRSPAVILEDQETLAALVPDVRNGRVSDRLPFVMDYVIDPGHLTFGVSAYTEVGHVYYELRPTPVGPIGAFEFSGWLWAWPKSSAARPRDLRPVERLLWQLFGQRNMSRTRPEMADLEPYVRRAYEWAFDHWGSIAWQEFELPNGERGGGVVAIVNARQKPGLGEEGNWREPKSLWNQAWFCSLRSAYGYARWGRAWAVEDWISRADRVLDLALSAPQENGLFPAYLLCDEQGGWASARWVASAPRRPAGLEKYVHLLDSSWACYWMLKWYRDVERDARILAYVRPYLERLLTLQEADGSVPAWVRPHDLATSPVLATSPETSMHALLFCLANDVMPDERFVEAACRAVDSVVRTAVATGRWEDFETYWSCASAWDGRKYGVPCPRSGLFNQCNFGIYWTAEALKAVYQTTGQPHFLDLGEQVLAELSLYQQIWEPPFLAVPTLGGFGVMNSDDEWNDARSSLFAITYLDYHRLTGDETYLLRGLWAMKSSFYMMYCPENPQVRELFERAHPYFDDRDFGFQTENFNHHDGTDNAGFAQFTIFDWGAGAAAASLAELVLGTNASSVPQDRTAPFARPVDGAS